MLLVLLFACRGDADAVDCTAPTLLSSWPAQDQEPVSRMPQLRVEFEGELPAEAVTAQVLADGEAVPGSLSVSSGLAIWTPESPLPEQASVEWSMDLCGQEASGAFRTGTEGEQVPPDGLADQSWALDMESATWVEPAGGELIFGQVFSGILLLGVQEISDQSIDLIGGAAQEVDGTLQQDPCVATFDFPASDFWNNPYFDVGPTVLEVEVQGLPVNIQDVRFSGAISGDGEAIADARLYGEVDARDIAPAVGASADQLCELLTSYLGVECVECTLDLEPVCLRIEVEEISGERVAGLRVAPNPDPQECEEGDDRDQARAQRLNAQ